MRNEANTQVEVEGTTAALHRSHRIVQAATEDKSSHLTENKNNRPTAAVVKTRTRLKATVVVNSQITPKATAQDNKKNTHPAVAMEVTVAVKNVTTTLQVEVPMGDKRSHLVEVAMADRKSHMADSRNSLTVVMKGMADSRKSHVVSSRATTAMIMRSIAPVAEGTVATTSNTESEEMTKMSTVGTDSAATRCSWQDIL